jgi:histidinol-phosphate aminotransferase
LEQAQRAGVLPIIDEAYIDFAGRPVASAMPFVVGGGRALVLRTLSKCHGLAGFRIGYAVGPPDVVSAILNIRRAVPFSVNRLAQKAAIAALEHPEYLEARVAQTAARRRLLSAELRGLGLGVVDSETNFLLVRLPVDSTIFAEKLRTEYGILTRDAAPFGYPYHIRVSLGSVEQLHLAIRAMRTVVTAMAASVGRRTS